MNIKVIAQEVQRVIPSAVEVLGDVSIKMANGETKKVKNLLVVNDHALLVETIGTAAPSRHWTSR